jgi:predicted MFS family arabinose efflux permease
MWGLGFYFVSPYQIGLVAALDRKGRVAVAAGAAFNFGYAVGPTIGGRILQQLDQTSLIIAVAGATLASMFLMLPLAIRVDRDRSGDPTAATGSEFAPR